MIPLIKMPKVLRILVLGSMATFFTISNKSETKSIYRDALLAIHSIIADITTELNIWYLDDGTMGGPAPQVASKLAAIIAHHRAASYYCCSSMEGV